MHGSGVFIWPDGRKYIGDYQTDQKHGQGKFIWADGKKFNGGW